MKDYRKAMPPNRLYRIELKIKEIIKGTPSYCSEILT